MKPATITSSCKASIYIRRKMRLDVEEVWCIALNSAKQVIASDLLFRGTVDSCLIHPRDIFKFAIEHNATSVIIAHNHPTGDSRPSASDDLITARLVEAGKLLQIPITDHVIVTDFTHYSYENDGKLGQFKSASISIQEAPQPSKAV